VLSDGIKGNAENGGGNEDKTAAIMVYWDKDEMHKRSLTQYSGVGIQYLDVDD
jgi:hypothetical protein